MQLILELTDESSSKSIFNNHKEFYNEALHNSSYKNELKYLETNRHHKNKGNNMGNNAKKVGETMGLIII